MYTIPKPIGISGVAFGKRKRLLNVYVRMALSRRCVWIGECGDDLAAQVHI